jgi:sterol desaturase/sphingolipid hydroxylase (fatty acid hydroxylase superfamily)
MQLQFRGYVIFIAIATIILATAVITKKILPWVSQVLLFFIGWLTWTFLEYISHRFWMHNKSAQKKKSTEGSHLYHHTHPTELKVTNTDRFLFLLTGILIIILAIILQNYFTLFAGLYVGFLSYTFMHVMLHRKWVKTFFPRLLQNHILHHCKFTNKCFGVTTIWWDRLFATSAPQNYQISEKVISYYFGDHQENNELKLHKKLRTDFLRMQNYS